MMNIVLKMMDVAFKMMNVVLKQASGDTTVLTRGRLVVVHCCNIDAFDLGCGRRFSASDGLDLAKSFPGRLEGSLTQRVAHTLTESFIRQEFWPTFDWRCSICGP